MVCLWAYCRRDAQPWGNGFLMSLSFSVCEMELVGPSHLIICMTRYTHCGLRDYFCLEYYLRGRTGARVCLASPHIHKGNRNVPDPNPKPHPYPHTDHRGGAPFFLPRLLCNWSGDCSSLPAQTTIPTSAFLISHTEKICVSTPLPLPPLDCGFIWAAQCPACTLAKVESVKIGRVGSLPGEQEGETTLPTWTCTDDSPRDGQSSQSWIYFED